MVGDDNIDAHSVETCNRRNSSRPAVTRDHDFRSRSDGSVHSCIAEVITILNAARNKGCCFATQDTNHPSENRRRADAVDVVVAVNEDQLLLSYRACKPLDRFVHREETEGIVQLIELRPEKELGILRGYKASDQQQSANDFWQRQRFHQRANGVFIGRFGKDPARWPNWSRWCRWRGLFRGECSHYRKLESAMSGLKRDHAPSA